MTPSPQTDLAAVLAHRAVVYEEKVGVAVVEVEAVGQVDGPVVGVVGHFDLMGNDGKKCCLKYTSVG